MGRIAAYPRTRRSFRSNVWIFLRSVHRRNRVSCIPEGMGRRKGQLRAPAGKEGRSTTSDADTISRGALDSMLLRISGATLRQQPDRQRGRESDFTRRPIALEHDGAISRAGLNLSPHRPPAVSGSLIRRRPGCARVCCVCLYVCLCVGGDGAVVGGSEGASRAYRVSDAILRSHNAVVISP